MVLTRDFDGLVIDVALTGRQILSQSGDQAVVRIAAGEDWHQSVCWTLDQGLSGLECLSLIPGQVGAAPVQNIGAYGVELSSVKPMVRAWDRKLGQIVDIACEQAGYAYRDSLFKQAAGRYLILSVDMTLSTSLPAMPRYQDLQQSLSSIDTPTAWQIAQSVIQIRQSKLPDPSVLGNAGSFFKNPVVAADFADHLKATWTAMPVFKDGNQAKLSAGWLIDQAGWKGVRRGAVGVSPNHALVLVHYGEGSGQALMALATEISESVEQKFGVQLEPEPRVI